MAAALIIWVILSVVLLIFSIFFHSLAFSGGGIALMKFALCWGAEGVLDFGFWGL